MDSQEHLRRRIEAARVTVGERANDPLVQQLMDKLMDPDADLPAVEELPPWFEDWARALLFAGQLHLARLAGLLMLRSVGTDVKLALVLVAPTARASDLPFLRDLSEQPQWHQMVDELMEAAQGLERRVADALVAAALPRHVDAGSGIAILSRNLGLLETLRPCAGGLLEAVIQMVRGITEDRARDHLQAEPSHRAFRVGVRRGAERLGDAGNLAPTTVERAASALDVPALSAGFVELSYEDLPPAPLERLLLAVALGRALAGSELAAIWSGAFAKLASDAIWSLRSVSLFSIRLKLLDELLGTPGRVDSRAELHFQRANTRRALSPNHPAETALVLADLEAAMELSRMECDAVTHANSAAAWAKTLAAAQSSAVATEQARLAQAEVVIQRALRLPVPDFERAILHQAHAHVLRLVRRDEAVAAFDRALDLLSPSEDFWTEVAAEVVTTLVRTGRPVEASSRGREFLEQARSDGRRTELGMLHLAYGEALMHSGHPAESRGQLEAGLALVRGADLHNEVLARFHLARLGLALDDTDLVDEHLRQLRPLRGRLDSVAHHDLVALEATRARHAGDFETARTAFLAAVETAATVEQWAIARLRLAEFELENGRLPEELERTVAAATSYGDNPEIQSLLFEVVCNRRAPLAGEARRLLVEWMLANGHPAAAARTLHLGGDQGEARRVLRGALEGVLSDHERRACLHGLMTILEPEARGERQRLCAEIERRLEGDAGEAYVLVDLAEALRMDAAGDESVLLRARRYGVRALEGVRGREATAIACRTVALIALELVKARIPLSSSAVAENASWVLGDWPLPEAELADLRLATAEALLLVGPCVHPDALDVAARLVDAGLPHTLQVQVSRSLADRLEWIRHRRFGEGPDRPPSQSAGPLDIVPAWLLAILAGRKVKIPSGQVSQGLRMLPEILRARPDLCDATLAAMLGQLSAFGRDARVDLLDTTYGVVQSTPDLRAEPWPRLRRALGQLPRRGEEGAIVARIESATHRGETTTDQPEGSREPIEPAVPLPPEQRLMQWFERGVALMNRVRLDPHALDAATAISESRQLLRAAVDLAKKKHLPHLFDTLVSLGNAWKTPPNEDVEGALRRYDEASTLDPVPGQQAKLWKVQADALLLRGRPEDVRRAERLLRRSLELRTGHLRAETLLSAAAVARAHPDLNEATRVRLAAEHLMDAVRTHRAHAEQVLPLLLEHLAAWRRLLPSDDEPLRLRGELKAAYPHRTRGIDSPTPAVPGREIETLLDIYGHPAGEAFMSIRTRLMSPTERATVPYGLLDGFGPNAGARIEAEADEAGLWGKDAEVEALAAALLSAPRDATWPGRAAARVCLLAHLARLRGGTDERAKAATSVAIESASGVAEPRVRSLLLREIAATWSPTDHASDPVRDFDLAVELLRQCVDLEGGEDRALDDTLGYLARAHRYSQRGDLSENLREAKRLYSLLLVRMEVSGDPAFRAQIQHNLAELESHFAGGTRLERLRRSIAQLVGAVEQAPSPARAAQYLATLAWTRVQAAHELDDEERCAALDQALRTFARVDPDQLEESSRRSFEANRSVCQAVLARYREGSDAEIALLRQHLASAFASQNAYGIATAKHNLANALLFQETVNLRSLEEGLTLLRDAALCRTLEADARHCWETALAASRGLRRALASGAAPGLAVTPASLWREAIDQVRTAIGAARVLGQGEELATTAFELCALALGAEATSEVVALLEEAWSEMRAASVWLILDTESREREAWTARRIAVALADRLSPEALPVACSGISFVLQGERAEHVRRWLARSDRATQRVLHARLAKPEAAGAASWQAWQQALASGNEREVASALNDIRRSAPGFLTDETDCESTWRWLEARPASIAVQLVLGVPTSMALLMQVGPDGAQRSWVLGIDLPPPPVRLEDLPAIMRGEAAVPAARETQTAAASWLRENAIEPVLRFLGERPSVALWCPGPGLRCISPGAIWSDVPVATAVTLAMTDRGLTPGRPRSTLVALADPGPGSAGGRDLLGHGLPSLRRLEKVAKGRGPVRTVGSVGKLHGRALLGGEETARDTPASAGDLVAEAAEHDLVVVIAHGEADTPETASLLCVDALGRVDRLDIDRLSRAPTAFAGSTIVLLSCESGRIGERLVEPGGIAGTLLSAGARRVVAPLWPVKLDTATDVAEGVLRGLADGQEPWEVLATLQPTESISGPRLGRPGLSPSEGRAESGLQRLAFITWVG